MLRGGAKQAQFGTDVSPKVLILGGLNCGNPIFNHIFKNSDSGLKLKIETFKEIIKDYVGRIVTPVFIGIRSGYLSNEQEVRALDNSNKTAKNNENEVKVCVLTPLEAANKIEEFL